MSKSKNSDKAKTIPRMGRVRLCIEYAVDLNNEDMVQTAKEMVLEDAMSAYKYGTLCGWIHTQEAPDLAENDIEDCLRDRMGEYDFDG